MVKMMMAIVKEKAERGLWLEEVPVPEIGINDVLVRVLKTGICGTDVHIYNWDASAQRTIPVPMVIGHEFVGRIAAIGSNVHDFSVGELVSGEGHVVCGRCRNCMAGRRHLCKDTKGIGRESAGAFAEFIALPVTNGGARRGGAAGRGGDFRSIRQCSAYGAFVRFAGGGCADHRGGADRHYGGGGGTACRARHVVVTDINPYRLEFARKLGATLAVDVRTQTISDVQKKLGMKEGFDVGLEMSGNARRLAICWPTWRTAGKLPCWASRKRKRRSTGTR